MPIGNVTTSYADRQIDLELLQSVQVPSGSQRVSISTVTKPPKVVAGVEKAVQRYALLFLTSAGEVMYDKAQGTTFVTALLRGLIQDNTALVGFFAAANDQVMRQLHSDDALIAQFGNQPDDERIATVQLTDFRIDFATATVILYLQLTMMTGTTVDFVVPVTTIR